MVLAHGAPEEALAAITGSCAVVFSRGPVPTDGAVLADGPHGRSLQG